MKRGSTTTYLHADHLGSTVLETNNLDNATADQKYYAYGKQRDTGSVVTEHKFTGPKGLPLEVGWCAAAGEAFAAPGVVSDVAGFGGAADGAVKGRLMRLFPHQKNPCYRRIYST